MKTILKNTVTLVLFITAILFIGTSCDNEADSSPNDNQCNYEGLTFLDTGDNTQTLIPESDLTTKIFSNPPNGIPAVEITTSTGSSYPLIEFRTEAITVGATEVITIWIDANSYNNVTVTCQRAGTLAGDEFRFDIVGGGVEAEFCVVVDNEVIYYEDLDYDGFGSQTVGTPSSANLSLNSDDCDDTDNSINPNATEIANDSIDSNCDGNDNT
jgi:hypothetical protein